MKKKTLLFNFFIIFLLQKEILSSLNSFNILTSKFPEYDNPITEEPLLKRPNSTSTIITIFKEVECTSWNLILTSNYIPPKENKKWSKIIFDMKITENGTQYDRYGAFWIGGLEILRTTTAEPTSGGIEWNVEKDLTEYTSYLLQSNIATLSIPNNVDSTYTGIPLVTITLTFYEVDEFNPSPLIEPEIYPLTNSPGDWSSMSVTNNSSLIYQVKLPLSNDVMKVELEMMASPHGCEEFWYTNIDNNTLASELGLCGGGVYREIQVYVDSYLAGTLNPNFVLYTGGINPYLWRPLTGIMSFDIPPYRFDLSPFMLTNGKEHTIELHVDGGDLQGGVWYLDGSLIIYHNSSLAPITGEFIEAYDSGSIIETTNNLSNEGYSWITTGSRNYSTKGIFYTNANNNNAKEEPIEYIVKGSVKTSISNLLTDSASVQLTSGSFRSVEFIESHNEKINNEVLFPFHINSSYVQDATSFDITASIEMSYRRIYSSSLNDELIQWNNNLVSSAEYNRTLDHSTVYIQSDKAHGNYIVRSSSNNKLSNNNNDDNDVSYFRFVSATNGEIINDNEKGITSFKSGKYICGYDLCQGNPKTTKNVDFSNFKEFNEPVTELKSKLKVSKEMIIPVRHPLMGKKHLESLLHLNSDILLDNKH